MDYAAIVSLKHTIERILNSSHISLVPRSTESLGFAYKAVEFAQNFIIITSNNNNTITALDAQIREAVSRLENELGPYASNQTVSLQSGEKETNPLLFSTDLNHLESQFYSFSETIMKLKEEHSSSSPADSESDCSSVQLPSGALGPYASNQTVSLQSGEKETNPLLFSTDLNHLESQFYSFSETIMKLKEEHSSSSPADSEADCSSVQLPSGALEGEMVGLSDEFREMKSRLTRFCPFPCPVFSIVGMAGIGKTTFALKLFEDPDILNYFACRAWVSVGRKHKLTEITKAILAQVTPWIEIHKQGDEKIALLFKQVMKSRKCLIVLDDVWETRVWHDLRGLLPDHDNGSRILLTTRLQQVARDASKSTYGVYEMRFLNKEESWRLLRNGIFGGFPCPTKLKRDGKKVADKCDGLPLTIVAVANLLSKVEKTPEFWNEVASGKRNSLFVNAYEEISKVLYPSYENITPHLKVCFLFLGFFPLTDEIPKSELINMWAAEGFFESQTSNSKYCALEYLGELISNNLVMVCQKSITKKEIKSCRLHSSLWYLCKLEAKRNMFFHVLQGLEEGGSESQRRLCLHTSILSGFRDVYESLESNCASTARFLFYYGPYHRYPVPICSGLTFLKVVNALTIRFYKFPEEVLGLDLLKYLALTYDGTLPNSISKLSNLEFLIVCKHLSIKYPQHSSHLPVEIWDMKELKHIQVTGSNLQDPGRDIILNLQTLLDVSAQSCTKDIFSRTPFLKKLGVRIEIVLDEPLCCFDDISDLYRLESLKCVVVNPQLRSMAVAPPPAVSKFPSGLTKLTLSGMGYPWEYMKVIASLPNLEVLKLRCYAFRGPKWETKESEFLKLKFVVIEDSDLVVWKVQRGSFPKLIRVSIRRCYKLEELHWVASHGQIIPDIVVVDCNFEADQIEVEKSTEGHLKSCRRL